MTTGNPSKAVPASPRTGGFWRRWLPQGPALRAAAWTGVYRDLARWVMIAVPIGVVAGLGAALFYYLINLFTGTLLVQLAGLTLPTEGTSTLSQLTWSSSFPRILIVPVLLVIGGLTVGIIIRGAAPEVAGHGTDATIRSFHKNAGKVRARVASGVRGSGK